MSYDCFISYNSPNLDQALLVYERLTVAGFDVWFDRTRLKPGFDWYAEVGKACDSSRVILPILTPQWRLSEWTRYETYGALAVIPLWVSGEWESVAPPPIRGLQRLPLAPSSASPDEWQHLFESIRRLRSLEEPQKTPRVTRLRYRPIDHFVGREQTLNALHEQLFTSPTAALTQSRVSALAALGGIGKTTIARHYAERLWRCYPQMFWVDCDPSPFAGFVAIHDALRPDLPHPLSDSEKASWAISELSQAESRPLRLLVLDNAEDESSIASWIPATGNCHTIITSRFADWSPSVAVCEVSVLSHSASVDLLSRRSGRGAAEKERAAMETVAQKVGYLPLALEQAAAFVASQPGLSFDDYLRLYEANEEAFLREHVAGATEYPQSLFFTWRTTHQKLPEGGKLLLRLHSFLSATPLPISVYIAAAGALGQEMRPESKEGTLGTTNEYAVRDWIRLLAQYSMARLDDHDCVSVHSLVQAVERHWLNSEREHALDLVTNLFVSSTNTPSWEPESRRQWALLIPHAEHIIHHRRKLGLEQSDTLLERVASAYYLSGQYRMVISPFRECLSLRQKTHGVSSDVVLKTQEAFAGYLREAGQYDEAEELQRSVLEIRRRTLAANDLRIAESSHALGQVVYLRGRVDEAVSLLSDALERYDSVDIETDPNALICMNDLAVALGQGKGDYEGSRRLLLRAGEVYRHAQGEDHPDTLRNAANLSRLLFEENADSEAESLCVRALNGRRRVLGQQHPETLFSISNLAAILHRRGSHEDAELLYRETLNGRDFVLGPDHPDTVVTAQRLATFLTESGRFEEAESLLRRYPGRPRA